MNAEPLSVSEPTPPHRYSMEGRRNATPKTSRFKAVFAALADVGVDAKPVVSIPPGKNSLHTFFRKMT